MVKIRLSRVGRKNRPAYRIVAIDSHAKRNGNYIESLGHYNPSDNVKDFVINKEKFDAWVKKGAQPTKAVIQLIEGSYVFKPYPLKTAELDAVIEPTEVTSEPVEHKAEPAAEEAASEEAAEKVSEENK
jgi:small subunit ribosomal protein S16